MGKPQKANGRALTHNERAKDGAGDSRININSYEDVADSEDEFHINRDKILLQEGPAQQKQRRQREEEAFLEPSDEEVLAASEDILESDEYFEDAPEIPARKTTKLVKSGQFQGSDSEISAAPEEHGDIGGWGSSRRDYYNADAIETEADALEEEAEVLRLEQKQREGMTEADFGIDEMDFLDSDKDDGNKDGQGRGKVIREVLPKFEITDAMEPEERMNILNMRYPEFEPLAKEFLELQPTHEDLKTAATEAKAVQEHLNSKINGFAEETDPPKSIAVVKFNILSAYLGALSMYFALLTSGPEGANGKLTAMPPEELHDHPIMDTLVQCRDLWQKVKDMVVPESSELNARKSPSPDRVNSELYAAKRSVPHDQEGGERPRKRRHRRSKADQAAKAAQVEEEALRAERLRKTEEELADLSALTAPSRLSKTSKTASKLAKTNDDNDSDFGEQTTLTPHEAAEKAKRKKSLRFYTSQIAQKSNKRDAAGRDAGGDTDIPYRERLKDRQARLTTEAENRGKKPKDLTKGDAPGGPSDDEDYAAATALRNDNGSGSEDYYDLVASRSADKKAAKAALAAAHAQAAREGGIVRIVEGQTVGVDGKRAINYQIEKNKGITPKRGKDVRNPRVKKRKKFAEKEKKLASMKPVWKGGEGRGGYGGEKTGIKAGLVKSVKL